MLQQYTLMISSTHSHNTYTNSSTEHGCWGVVDKYASVGLQPIPSVSAFTAVVVIRPVLADTWDGSAKKALV